MGPIVTERTMWMIEALTSNVRLCSTLPVSRPRCQVQTVEQSGVADGPYEFEDRLLRAMPRLARLTVLVPERQQGRIHGGAQPLRIAVGEPWGVWRWYRDARRKGWRRGRALQAALLHGVPFAELRRRRR